MSNEASEIGYPLTGRSFEDQLLLAIIDAYPDPNLKPFQWERKREKRLSAAKSALFNSPASRGPVEYDDERALFHMAQEYLKDRSMVTPKSLISQSATSIKNPRSYRQLASEAAKMTAGTSRLAIIDRLRKAFERRKDKILVILSVHDFIPETEERNALKRVFEILKRQGILIKFNEEK